MNQEICICSAVLTEDDQIIRGHRHNDCIRAIRDRNLKPKSGNLDDVQGFITSNNRYVGREEGYKLQIEAGIESADKGGYRGERLYSEDLY